MTLRLIKETYILLPSDPETLPEKNSEEASKLFLKGVMMPRTLWPSFVDVLRKNVQASERVFVLVTKGYLGFEA